MNYNRLPGFMKYYQCIKDHYPLSIFSRSYWYFATDEAQMLYQKISNKQSTDQYRTLKSFQKDLNTWQEFSEVEFLDIIASPGAGLKATLSKNKANGSLSEFYFFISFLGPFYCFFGKETGNEKWGYKDISVIVNSPEQHYEAVFHKMEAALLKIYPAFSFVPFRYLIQNFEGLFGPYPETEEPQSMCLFQALFHYYDIRRYLDFGDLGYQRELWTASKTYYDLKANFEDLKSKEGNSTL